MFTNLRTHLVLIALSTLIPAAFLALIENISHREDRMEGLRRETLWAARAVAERQEKVVEVSRRLLKTLAQLPEVREAELPDCVAILKDVVAVQRIYHTIALVDTKGDFVCSPLPVPQGQANVADRPYFKRLLKSRSFEVGEHAMSRTTGKRSIHFAWPILDTHDEVRSALIASYDLSSIGGLPSGTLLPPDTILRVTDRDGVVLYRDPPWEEELGRRVDDEKWALIQGQGQEAARLIDDGRGERLLAARRVNASGQGGDMAVIIEADLEGFCARMNRELALHLAALGGVCLGALCLALYAGKRLVVDRVEHLARVSDRLAAGELSARAAIPGGAGEFGRLAASINAMAEAIDARDKRLGQTLRELERTERNSRSIYENAAEGIFQSTPGGRLLSANPALARLLGFDSPEALIRETHDLAGQVYADPEDRKRFLGILASQGKVSGFVVRFRRRDGELLWCLVNARLARFEPDGEEHLEGFITSINESKLAQERLARSERLFKAIVDNALEGIIVAKNGFFVFVNPMVERMTGVPSEGLLDRPFTDFVHPDDRELVHRHHLARAVGHSAPPVYDFRILAAGGGFLWVMASAVYFEWDGQPASLAMLSDITERKNAERALRQAEARYRDIFENAPVAIFRATPKGRFIVVNPTYAAMAGFGSAREMVEGITDIAAQMYVDPAEREVYKRQLAERGAVRDFEARLKRRDGGMFWASMTSRVVRDETGEIASYDGFLTDVTTRKQAEEALRQARDTLEAQVAARTVALKRANERLMELDRQRATFLSSASHELRTPLTSVLGFAKLARRTFSRHFEPLARDEARLEAKSRIIIDNLAIIEQEGERLTRLVNDLLDINKIEAGRMEWRDTTLDVAEEMAGAAKAMHGAVAAKPGLRFSLRVAADAGRIVADRDRLRQMVLNLLSNAIKYTDKGHVRLGAQSLPDGGLRIRVEDSGVGVAESDRERIFQKFYQGPPVNPDEDKPAGTGLGLAICKNIVEHYGGGIRVESEVGRGSAFVVDFPETIRPRGERSPGSGAANGVSAM